MKDLSKIPALLRFGLPILTFLLSIIFWNFDPNSSHSLFPKCNFLAITGFYCTGCGITRALHALAHGNIIKALSMNGLATILILISPFWIIYEYTGNLAFMRPISTLLQNGCFWIITLIGFWVLRNLPWIPFIWLAPH